MKLKLGNKRYLVIGMILFTLGIIIAFNRHDIYDDFEKYIKHVTHAGEEGLTVQRQIADEILRLHVIANSDTEEDQTLKLKVKDKIVNYLKEVLKDADDLETAREVVGSRLQDLEEIAEDVITEEGYTYSVEVSLGEQEFPIKMYGDLVFPAGIYQAVQIKIGGYQGKNWWCVLFPNLCFVDGTYSIVPEEAKEELEAVIGEDNYKTLLTTEKIETDNTEINETEQKTASKIEIRWKIADWFSK